MHIDNVIFLALSNIAYTKFSAGPDRKHFQLQQFSEIGHLHLYKIVPSLLIYLSDKVSQKKSS